MTHRTKEHKPSHHCDYFTVSRWCLRCCEVGKSPHSSVCPYFCPPFLHTDLIIPTAKRPFSHLFLHLPCPSYNTNHCRACFKPTQCLPHCPSGPSSIVLGSPVQSSLLSNFDKTETWNSPHKLTNLEKLDQTDINHFSAVLVGFLQLKDQSQPVSVSTG
jgi:hypothetical protein